jgi:hypothetical protein
MRIAGGLIEGKARFNMNHKVMHRSATAIIGVVVAAFLFFIGPNVGRFLLRCSTPAATITTWKAEAERLDSSFPRTAANEASRLEMIRKLRQRGVRVDEGVDESTDHKNTPYAVLMRGCREWRTLFGG